MTSSLPLFFSRATILRASSNGHACDCSASARRSEGFSIVAVVMVRSIDRYRSGLEHSFGTMLVSKRTDREIAQPEIGEAALLPQLEQRPVQGEPQQIVAALDRDADAFAKKTAFQKRPAAKGAAAAGVRAIEPERERDAVVEQQIDLLAPQGVARRLGVGIRPNLG